MLRDLRAAEAAPLQSRRFIELPEDKRKLFLPMKTIAKLFSA